MNYGGYDIIEKRGSIIIKGVVRFDPVHIFECGQCFRWNRENDGSYTGVAMGRVINVLKDGQCLVIRNATVEEFAEIWFDYFDLGRDYNLVAKSVSTDEIMKKAVEFGHGIRILRQEFFETLISFIISSNNSISRIKKIVENLSGMYGRKISFNGRTYYAFPEPAMLADARIEEICRCRGGYRCGYVIETSRMFAAEPVDRSELASIDVHMAKNSLMKYRGVGEKVAECTLLYSGTRHDIFPTDVWVKRVMEELYFKREASSTEIHGFAASRFGLLSGFAQQYLFYYAREKKIGTQNNR